MIEIKDNPEYKEDVKCVSYKIGKYKINVKREFENQGASILENVMCMIYDEMKARKNKKD